MGGIVSCISNLMYISEKITLCTACTGLICCLVLTITMTLGMGIGLGYNYCFVDMRTKFKHIRGHYVYPGSPRWPQERAGHVVEEPEIEEISEDDALRRPQYIPEDVTSISDVVETPKSFHEKPHSNFTLTGDEDIFCHRTSVSDSESFNRTATSVNTTIDVANNGTTAKDDMTANSVTSPESSSSISTSFFESFNTTVGTSFSESSMKTASTAEVETSIKVQTKEPIPEPPTVKNSSGRKVKKLVIPITGLDLISLLSKLSAENRNYSLQVVTT